LPAELDGLEQAAISTQAAMTAATAPRFLALAITLITSWRGVERHVPANVKV
jgi:hypothetical protein